MPQSSEIVEYCAYRDCAGTVRSDAYLYTTMRARAGAAWPEVPVREEPYALGDPLPNTPEADRPTAPVKERGIGGSTLYQRRILLPPEPRNRSSLLSLILVLRMAADVIAFLLILVDLLQGHYTMSPQLVLLLPLILISIGADLVCLWGIWRWQSWGVIGTIGISLVGALLAGLADTHLETFLARIVGLIVFLAVIRPQWDQME